MVANLYMAWIAFLAGSLAGLFEGLFFHDERWLGGYGSWKRRMVRLGHVAFFGLGLLNLAFALTAGFLRIEDGLALPSVLLVIGVLSMPMTCYLAAFRRGLRHLFAVPALAVVVAIVVFLGRVVTR